MEFNNLKTETAYFTFESKFSFLNWLYTYLVLPFNMEHQTQSNWCWAATSKSVSHFYSFFSPWTQCKIASAELGNTCCNTPVPSVCNVPWYLNKALTRTNNFVSIHIGTISWTEVKQQLQAGLVVGTRIGWSGGGGHFMSIHGVSSFGATQYLHIDDPIYGKSVLTYNQFATNYQGSGSWTHTYFTKKYRYFMWFKDLLFKQELLRPIPEIRPLINVYDKKIEENIPGKYSIPHYAYILGLNEIHNEFTLPSIPKTLRVIEMQNETPVALYEVGTNETNPELVQMNVSEIYFKQLDDGLARLKRFAEQNKELGEVRLIKVPALNIEALWLHYDSGVNDIISPIKKFENDTTIDWDKWYDEKQFIQLLQQLAEKIDTTDDLLGA
jgi:hypothetical protein